MPACWRSPPVHHVFLATGATGGVEVEGGGRLNAAENTSFHSAVRRSPNFCRDRGFCRLISRCHVNCEYVHCLFCAYCHCRCRLYDNCWSYLYSAFFDGEREKSFTCLRYSN